MRKLHRAATIIVGVQLLVWTVTGFAFTWFDFARVRATADRAPRATLDASAVQVSVKDAMAKATGRVVGASLHVRSGRPMWLLATEGEPVLVDAQSGAVVAPPAEADAGAIARAAIVGEPAIASINKVASADDLSGPQWRVRLSDPHATDVFVDATTGEIAAVRNSTWRWFDRLWSLHVLGWVSRDNPAHLPLRVLAGLALLVALSGAALLIGSWIRRRALPAAVVLIMLLAARPAHAMHLAEGILPMGWAAAWFAVALPFIAIALYLLRRREAQDAFWRPFVAMVAAVVFLVSCMPVPVPTAGTCSHPCGTGLAAILIGPWLTVLVTLVALILQALFLAHGGLTTLGADVVSMGVAGAFVGWGAFVLLRRASVSLWVAAFVAGLLSDWATYATTSVELAAALRGEKSFGTLFGQIALAFVPTQLPLGILEGLLSAGAVAFLYRRRRDILVRLSVVPA